MYVRKNKKLTRQLKKLVKEVAEYEKEIQKDLEMFREFIAYYKNIFEKESE